MAGTAIKRICILCERFVHLEEATVEHIKTKGAGEGKHDDRLNNLVGQPLVREQCKGLASSRSIPFIAFRRTYQELSGNRTRMLDLKPCGR